MAINDTELKFKNHAINKFHYRVKHASKHEDMFDHWDFEISDGKHALKVEVKGRKKLNRQNVDVQDEWVWIELTNVRGDKGWLYGKADIIAFETSYGFIFMSRTTLQELVDKVVNKKEWVTQSKDAKYKLYRRHGRLDTVTMIHMTDIERNKYAKWIIETE